MDNENNTICATAELSEEENDFLYIYIWWVEVWGNVSISIIGVVLNFITIVVHLTSTMRNNFFNRLLVCLAIFDNLYLFCEISEVARLKFYSFPQQYIFANFIYPIRSVFLCSSIYMTIGLTLERYEAIASPVNYRARGSDNQTKRLLTYVLPILVVNLFYYAPKFLELEVAKNPDCNPSDAFTNSSEAKYELEMFFNCTHEYILLPSKLRTNHHYLLWYMNISNLILTAFIPAVTLLYLSCKIYLSLGKFIRRQPTTHLNSQRQLMASIKGNRRHQMVDEKKTFILFSLIVVFVICHSLRIGLNVDEFLNLATFVEEQEIGCNNPKFWDQVLVPMNQMLLIINASAHFFIYVFFDHGFQQVLRNAMATKSELLSHKTTITKHTRTQKEHLKYNNGMENVEMESMNNNFV